MANQNNMTMTSHSLLIGLCLLCTIESFAQPTAILNWAKRTGGTGADRSRDMVADAAGNVYTTGYYTGTVDFDPGAGVSNLTSAGSSDIFMSKMDANGNLVWAKSVGGTGGDSPMAIAIDATGNVYITGGFVGTADFDPGPGVFSMTAAGQTDIYIAKYDASGNFVWAKGIIGGTWFDHGYSILVDGTGNVHVVGRFYYQGGARDFDPGPGTFFLTADWEDIFILKLDNDGNFIWAKDIGNVLESRGYSVALDAAGNIYTTGYFLGTVDFDPGAGTFNLTSVGGSTGWDVFFCKLDANGNFVWAKAMVNSTSTYYTDGYYGRKIAVDASGNVYSSGRYSGTTDFDFGTGTFNLTPTGGYDAYLLKMSTDGDFVWAKSFGGTGYDEAFSICLGTTGDIYLTGFFVNTVDFDPGAGTFNVSASGANDDIFVSKFDENGNFAWARAMGGTLDDQGFGISTDGSDNIYVSGWFQGTADFDPGACTANLTSAGADDAFTVKLTQVIATPLNITSVSPSVGIPGSTITIIGTGFSTTPANNSVTFNSTAAVVTASTATSITVTVPAGATTGKISVTTDCVTVSSVSDFIVADNFITQWNLATAGSGATQLTFGTATSGTVNYTWQEISPGTTSGSGSWSGATLTITSLPPGATIRLQIAPTNFQRIIINIGSDRNRLRQVEQWGTTVWTSMLNAFAGCSNLQVTATDVPNLSGLTSLAGMFRFCTTLNSPSNIGSWNTSAVTDMSALFSSANAFNQNISSWNTSSVTNMAGLFSDASSFNQNIGVWNTAAVTNMSSTFSGAVAFNQNIGAWNTAAVTNMSAMFFSAYAFNQNISGWNTAAVTNMSSMFGFAYNFNQNIGTWNTGAVTNMSRMFEDAFAFNQNIGTWNTSAVTNMRGMFIDAYAFNQNIGTWNTSAVTDLSRMFDFATAFNQNIGAWNTAAVTNMSGMFADASDFNQNIGTWSLNPGVNLTGMFNNSNMDCSTYSATLIGWNANPSTPSGRTLGATGRQYGTNALAARTNLTTTKGWTITGDTPSGAVCALPVSVPTITSFTPTSGPIGTTVIINGTNFNTTPANNIVYFGATKATVTTATATQLTVTVPLGATYQPVSVAVSGLTGFSAKPFNVTFCSVPGITSGSFATPIDVGTGTTSGPVSIAVGDLDGDGKADMAVANRFANTVSLFRNTSSSIGTISYAPKIDLTVGLEPVSVTLGDLDGDGKGDLAVAIFGDFTVSVFRNTSSGPGNISFATKVDFLTGPPGAGPFSVALGDLDKDGKTDLAIANSLSNQAAVLRNTSSGTGNISFAARIDFPIGAGAVPYSISIGDIDLDGKLDLATSNANSISVFRNISSGVGDINYAPKVDFSTGAISRSVSIGDLDGDDKPDLAATAETPDIVSVFRNTSNAGSLSFAARQDFATASTPWLVSIGDLDGDGKADLVTANEVGANVSVLRNVSTVGNVSFNNKVDFSAGSGFGLVAVSLGDFDNDGKSDLVAAEFNGDVVSVLRNTIATAAPTITSFSPTSGNVGTFVTIFGTNFNAPPPSDVTFNGVSAPIIDFTPTSISVNVPAGATTGPIQVIGCSSVTSATNFTIGSATITITTQPSDASICAGGTTTFTTAATGTTNITYQWQRYLLVGSLLQNISNGGAYSGATTATLTINSSTGSLLGDFYTCVISGDNSTPVSTGYVTLTVGPVPCSNQPPVIASVSAETQIEGKVSLDLVSLISDTDNNLDIQSLKIITQPTSGAKASITASGRLELDYQGISFSGPDVLTIEVCDLLGDCTQQEIKIEVIGDLNIYNGISPNGDLFNEVWIIKYIEAIDETKSNKVSVYNRWGDLVWETENYDNKDRVFKGLNKSGNELPSGTYFYRIEFSSGRKALNGYLSLRR